MYFQNETLLAKKIHWKKISVSIVWLSDEEICEKMAYKELEYWKTQLSYQNFTKELFDVSILESVVYKNAYVQNMLFFTNKISGKLSARLLDFPQRFIYESNKTEGSRIPFDQLQLIFQDKKTSYQNKLEIQEVKNSIEVWRFLQDDFVFNEVNIKKVYHKLTYNLLMQTWERYPRWFRKIDVIVNNNQTTSPENISSELQNLLKWYIGHKKNIFPLELAFDFHLRYEQIHPFRDGNGRTGRMLMNKILLAQSFLPCIVFSKNREAYFSAIDSASSRRKKKYYKFMLEQYDKTLTSLMK